MCCVYVLLLLFVNSDLFQELSPTPGQEELKDWQFNPDVPTMKLYRCWDSSAIINKTDTSRNVSIKKDGELSAEQAAAMMFGPQTICFQINYFFFQLVVSRSINPRSNPASISPAFHRESVGPASVGTPVNSEGGGQHPEGPAPKPKPVKPKAVPKAKTSAQEARAVVWFNDFLVNCFCSCSGFLKNGQNIFLNLGDDKCKQYDLGMRRLMGQFRGGT